MSVNISQTLRLGEVISLKDPQGGDRIKVKILSTDNFKNDVDEIDYAMCFLPKFIHVKPKIGEYVYVITENSDNSDTQRYFIGPIISQINKIEGDTDRLSALSLFRGGEMTPGINPNNLSGTTGTLPEDDDVAILGRKNSDIIITENDVQIRSGVKLVENQQIDFNEKDPSYMLLRYHPDKNENSGEYKSTATIVADKINLISNDSEFKTKNRDGLISDEEMDRLIQKAHAVPYGDVLVEFLEIFKKAFNEHTHPMIGDPPCEDDNVKNLKNFDMENILSDNIKID